jgi:hypothetical protein
MDPSICSSADEFSVSAPTSIAEDVFPIDGPQSPSSLYSLALSPVEEKETQESGPVFSAQQYRSSCVLEPIDDPQPFEEICFGPILRYDGLEVAGDSGVLWKGAILTLTKSRKVNSASVWCGSIRDKQPMRPQVLAARLVSTVDGYHMWESALGIKLSSTDRTECPYVVMVGTEEGNVITSPCRHFTLPPSDGECDFQEIGDNLGQLEIFGDIKVLRVLSSGSLPASLQVEDSALFFERHRETLASVPLFCPIRLEGCNRSPSLHAAYPGDWRDVLHWFVSLDQPTVSQIPVFRHHLDMIRRCGKIPCPVSFSSLSALDISASRSVV